MHEVIFVMGVSGSGKSTIGKALAKTCGYPFYDGDDFHSKHNIEKMKSGRPLDDADREDWLTEIRNFCLSKVTSTPIVIACSALKEKYRNFLSDNGNIPCQWVFLEGSFELILARIQERSNHFMPIDLLKSQFADLERPKNAIVADISFPIDLIIRNIIKNKSQPQSCRKRYYNIPV